MPPSLLSKLTPEYQNALAVLAALGEDSERVIAIHLQTLNLQRAEQEYGKLAARRHLGWLRDKQEPRYHSGDWRDHEECRKTVNGCRHFISQPYSLGHDDLVKLLETCREHRLKCRISADSWHFPNRTLLVVVETAEQDATAYARSVAALKATTETETSLARD